MQTESVDRRRPRGSASALTGREPGIDAARGLAVVLVVLGHVLGGLRDAGLSSGEGPQVVARGVYSFHAAALLFLSGVTCSLRPSLREIVVRRARTLLWPFLVWTIVYLELFQVTRGLTNSNDYDGLEGLPSALLDPVGVLWYLETLFLCIVLLKALQSVSASRLLPLAVGSGLLVLSISVTITPGIAARVATSFFFVAAGYHAGRSGVVVLSRTSTLRWLLPAGLTLLVIASSGDIPAWLAPFSRVVEVLAFVGVTARLAPPLLAYLGRHSLAIFVAHAAIAPATRIAIQRTTGSTSFWMYLVLEMTTGIGLSLVLEQVLVRVRASWVFVLPQPRSATATPPGPVPS